MKYIILAKDRTQTNLPRRIWIFSSKKEAMRTMDFLIECGDWEMPQFMEVDEIIIMGKY